VILRCELIRPLGRLRPRRDMELTVTLPALHR
jgi:hypothetical protein